MQTRLEHLSRMSRNRTDCIWIRRLGSARPTYIRSGWSESVQTIEVHELAAIRQNYAMMETVPRRESSGPLLFTGGLLVRVQPQERAFADGHVTFPHDQQLADKQCHADASRPTFVWVPRPRESWSGSSARRRRCTYCCRHVRAVRRRRRMVWRHRGLVRIDVRRGCRLPSHRNLDRAEDVRMRASRAPHYSCSTQM